MNGSTIPSNTLQIPNPESHGQSVSGGNAVGHKSSPSRVRANPSYAVFAGLNTTGAVAQREARRWVSFEM